MDQAFEGCRHPTSDALGSSNMGVKLYLEVQYNIICSSIIAAIITTIISTVIIVTIVEEASA